MVVVVGVGVSVAFGGESWLVSIVDGSWLLYVPPLDMLVR